MELKNLLLISDIDGTLIDENYQIPARNREAIEKLEKAGGGFAIATGRSWESVAQCIRGLPVNRPCVLANGGVIFDMEKRQPVWFQALPEEAKEYTHRIMEAFPEAGIEVFTASDVWILRQNEITLAHMTHEGLHFQLVSEEEIREPWCKVLVASPEQDALKEFCDRTPHEGMRFVASSDRYWEMLPEQADKGTGIQKLAELCGIPMESVAAIGDYYNDLEMLQTAGITAVPQNGPEEIQKLADVVTCHCNDGTVADFIEYLEQKDD